MRDPLNQQKGKAAKLPAASKELAALRARASEDWDAFVELTHLPSALIEVARQHAKSPLQYIQITEARRARNQMEQEAHVQKERERQIKESQQALSDYWIYCRKHGVTPSLEHAKKFLPVLLSHDEENLKEAWKREESWQTKEATRTREV